MYGNATALLEKSIIVIFCEQNLLTLLLCCILCCLPAPRADLTRFRLVIVLGVSTAKRKTRLHTDFRTARRLNRINPLKTTLPTQFVRRIEEEMSKLHVSSLATQFRPQRLRYDTLFFRDFFARNFKNRLVLGYATLSRFA